MPRRLLASPAHMLPPELAAASAPALSRATQATTARFGPPPPPPPTSIVAPSGAIDVSGTAIGADNGASSPPTISGDREDRLQAVDLASARTAPLPSCTAAIRSQTTRPR